LSNSELASFLHFVLLYCCLFLRHLFDVGGVILTRSVFRKRHSQLQLIAFSRLDLSASSRRAFSRRIQKYIPRRSRLQIKKRRGRHAWPKIAVLGQSRAEKASDVFPVQDSLYLS